MNEEIDQSGMNAVPDGYWARQSMMQRQNAIAQRDSFYEYAGVMRQAQQRRAQNQLAMQNDEDTLMRLAAENGGQVPEECVALYNRKFGFDGKTSGIIGGGYDQDGNFSIVRGGGLDPFNRPVLSRQTLSPMQQWGVMNRNTPTFDDQTRQAFRGMLERKGFSSKEIEAAVPQGGTPVPGWWLAGGDRKSSIQAFGADGRGGFTRYDNGAVEDYGTRVDPNNPRNWDLVERGAYDRNGTQYSRYVNRVTHEQETVPDGEEPPWQRGANGSLGASEKLALEQLKQDGLDRRAAAANDTKKELAGQRADVQREGIASREKIAGVQMSGRKDIANIQAAVQRDGFLSRENIAKLQEAGRMERATQRNNLGWAKLDDATEKWKASYEVALKKAKNDEERNRIIEKYNDGRNAIAEGRLDLDWKKFGEDVRHNQATEGIQKQRADTEQYKAETAEELGRLRAEENKRWHDMLASSQESARKQRETMGEKNYQLKLKELEAKVSGRIQNGKSGRSNAELVLGLVPRLMQTNRMVPDEIHGSRPEPVYKSEDEALDAAIDMVNKVRQMSDGGSAQQAASSAAQQPAASQSSVQYYPPPAGKPSTLKKDGVTWRILYDRNGTVVGKQRIK